MHNKNKKVYFCRICGYLQDEFLWGEDNKSPNYDFCPCCGVEFGYQDCQLSAVKKYREMWLKNGAKWSEPEKKPKKWSFTNQLKNIPEEFQ